MRGMGDGNDQVRFSPSRTKSYDDVANHVAGRAYGPPVSLQ
jgi:hypothetical protein